jgi:hypothetical protein
MIQIPFNKCMIPMPFKMFNRANILVSDEYGKKHKTYF